MISETTVHELQQLAELIACRNELEKEISQITGRPAQPGPLGEYIAARIFAVNLLKGAAYQGAAHQAIDGFFAEGPLAPCSVNVKWYAVRVGVLDIIPGFLPDFYLVLTGPPPSATAGLRLRTRPWKLTNVYLFDAAALVDDLELRGVRVGVTSSVRKELWEAAEIYPRPANDQYPLSNQQRELLALFN